MRNARDAETRTQTGIAGIVYGSGPGLYAYSYDDVVRDVLYGS